MGGQKGMDLIGDMAVTAITNGSSCEVNISIYVCLIPKQNSLTFKREGCSNGDWSIAFYR